MIQRIASAKGFLIRWKGQSLNLTWTAVANRISELIAVGRYLSDREREQLPEFEKEVLNPVTNPFYTLYFRVLRFAITENTMECVLTNLEKDEFLMEEIKKLYRWR